ncbi:MAG: glycine cleavage system protein GcvH [Oligoflexia bacterium]|nr:glycine cleavage system protein GcvH [Oligoflexia bacterium]
MSFPSDLKYTKDHEWAKTEGKTVTIGVTDHAQKALGDIVYVELPAVGRALKKHETFGVVESIKAVSDLYSPIAGKVLEVNTALTDEPAMINRDPHKGAWMVKMELTDPASMSDLMDAQAYTAYVATLK